MPSQPARPRGPASSLTDSLAQYARLMRLDRPVGIWLLLWPTLWALWIAGEGRPQAAMRMVSVYKALSNREKGG